MLLLGNLQETSSAFIIIIIIIYLYYYLRSFPCLDFSFFSLEIPLHPYIYVETKLKDNLVKMQL